jgi:large subunit ribosomal protein L23Ae
MVKTDKITKAAKTAERMKKTQQIQKRKTRTNVHFFRPKTLKQARNPRAPKTSVSRINNMDKFKIIRAPCNSEASMKKVEEINTLVREFNSLDNFV